MEMIKKTNIQIDRYTKNFAKWEFLCRHCGAETHNPRFLELVQILQDLRYILKAPIHITSGYRCPYHPVELAKPNGPGLHTQGIAVDFTTVDMDLIYTDILNGIPTQYYPMSFQAIKGIAYNEWKGYIHIDIRETPKLVTWSYDEEGKVISV